MDKRLDFPGGNPDVRLDQILIDAEANRPAMFAMLKSYAVGTNPNYVIDGCEVLVGGVSPNNTWSISAGYVFLNDEILQVASDSGVFDSSTEFLAMSKVVTFNTKGDIVYNDATPRQTWQENRGVITVQGSVAFTEIDAVRTERLDGKIKRYTGGALEEFTPSVPVPTLTIQDATKYVYVDLGTGTGELIIPNPGDNYVFNDELFIRTLAGAGPSLTVKQVNGTVVLSAFSTSRYIHLVNTGSVWFELLNIAI